MVFVALPRTSPRSPRGGLQADARPDSEPFSLTSPTGNRRLLRHAALLGSTYAWLVAAAGAQGSVAGKVRSPAGDGVAGVVIRLDGDSLDATSAAGDFHVRVATAGPHTVMFSHPRFMAVMPGIEYQIDVDADTAATALTVEWPDLGQLIERACSGVAGHRGVAMIGSVRPPPRSVLDTVDVVAGWDAAAMKSERRFGGVAARARADGSFLLCGLPPAREVRLYVRRGLAVGVTRSVTTPPKGFVELVLPAPP